MLSVGIGGGITGNPGHWILIDDVIKNMEEAGSPATKRKHLEEWDGSISARFQEETKVVITATRWNEDDLSGEIIARAQAPDYEGVPVRVIRIKAIAEPDEDEELAMSPEERVAWRDPIGRKIGETLDGQHSRGFFLERRASVGPYVWNALYQASPSARKGSMFPMENWGWYDPDNRPKMSSLRRGWDIAATEGGGDFSVGAHVGRADDGRIYILDIRRFRYSTSGVKDEVMRAAKADGYGTRILMEQESAGSGKTVIGAYEHDLRAYDFMGVRPEGEKVSRYTNYSDLQQRGHVLLPRRPDGSSPEWVQPFVAEHKMMMPDGRGPRHDDQLDACRARRQRPLRRRPDRDPRPARGADVEPRRDGVDGDQPGGAVGGSDARPPSTAPRSLRNRRCAASSRRLSPSKMALREAGCASQTVNWPSRSGNKSTNSAFFTGSTSNNRAGLAPPVTQAGMIS